MIHEVAPGECLVSLAHRYGFSDPRILYDHPANAELRRARPNLSVLAAGDRVFIPERSPRAVECSPGTSHRFRVKRPAVVVRLVLRDREENPIRDSDYVLHVGGTALRGRTSGGLVEQRVPPTVDAAELVVASLGLRMTLRIGHLDPIDTPSGLKARLRNLRYPVGATDSIDDPTTARALRAFARKEGIGDDGGLDAIRSALTRKHGI